MDQISQSGFHPGNWADRVKLQSYRIDVSRCQPYRPGVQSVAPHAAGCAGTRPSGPAADGDYNTNRDIDQDARVGTGSAV